jgi:hypothetical protein
VKGTHWFYKLFWTRVDTSLDDRGKLFFFELKGLIVESQRIWAKIITQIGILISLYVAPINRRQLVDKHVMKELAVVAQGCVFLLIGSN